MLSIYQAKGDTLEEQYYDMGTLFGESIRLTVASIARRRGKQGRIRRLVAEKTLANLRNTSVAQEFLRCIKAWADGAHIKVEQAMWLMADNLSGCQTLMVRYGTGVALLHTEEDYDDMSTHMTGEQVASFADHGELSRCLVYNDLMPGAGLYGWKRDLVVAVDTLFLKEEGIEDVESPMLANVLAWIVWRMKPEDARPEIIQALSHELGELIDGYAINIVRKVGNIISGYKITLARTESRVEYLGSNPSDYLRQVNIVDPKYPPMKWASNPRNIWRGGYRHFLERLETIDKHMKEYSWIALQSLDCQVINNIHFNIQMTIYGDLSVAYINENVGAVCVGLVDQSGTSVSCKLNDKKIFEKLDYMDLLGYEKN